MPADESAHSSKFLFGLILYDASRRRFAYDFVFSGSLSDDLTTPSPTPFLECLRDLLRVYPDAAILPPPVRIDRHDRKFERLFEYWRQAVFEPLQPARETCRSLAALQPPPRPSARACAARLAVSCRRWTDRAGQGVASLDSLRLVSPASRGDFAGLSPDVVLVRRGPIGMKR